MHHQKLCCSSQLWKLCCKSSELASHGNLWNAFMRVDYICSELNMSQRNFHYFQFRHRYECHSLTHISSLVFYVHTFLLTFAEVIILRERVIAHSWVSRVLNCVSQIETVTISNFHIASNVTLSNTYHLLCYELKSSTTLRISVSHR